MYHNHKFLIAPERPASDTLRVPVLKIFDGDGFQTKITPLPGIEIEATVRFGFIDAPEMAQPGGREARDFLRSLIGGKSVDIAILTKMDTGKSIDRYRRIVCVPYLSEEPLPTATERTGFWTNMFGTRQTLTRNIELEMVLNGWAWVLDRYGPDERYREALEDARRARRGIWAFDRNLNPWEFKKQKHQARKPVRILPKPQTHSHGKSDKLSCLRKGCTGHLMPKSGKFGKFLGCSNFPVCNYTRNQ